MSQKTALVTGATGGIGRAIAKELGATHHIYVAGRNVESVAGVVAELPSAEPLMLDLFDSESIARACESISKLDVFVHSAGQLDGRNTVANATQEDFRTTFGVHTFALADLCARLLPSLRSSRGLIAIINSMSGLRTLPNTSVYAGSKYAARALADAMREEERENGVRVMSIFPGLVGTDSIKELGVKEPGKYNLDNAIDPNSIAKLIRLAVELPEGDVFEEVRMRTVG